jgi:D-amino-acid oxidase
MINPLNIAIESFPQVPAAYIIPRMDGTAVLGGTYQHSWDLSVDYEDAARIHSECVALIPELQGAKIISHNVGLRPGRKGGARVEKETMPVPLSNNGKLSSKLAPLVPLHSRDHLNVVHAYGIGPAGYQSSWGLASEAVGLVMEFFSQEA